MTTTAEVNLQQKFSAKERDEMLIAYAEACGQRDYEKADKILEQYPINPRWAGYIAEVMGKEYLLEHFNITYANEVLGEDWLNEK